MGFSKNPLLDPCNPRWLIHTPFFSSNDLNVTYHKQLLAEDQKIIPTNLSHGNRGFIWSTYARKLPLN